MVDTSKPNVQPHDPVAQRHPEPAVHHMGDHDLRREAVEFASRHHHGASMDELIADAEKLMMFLDPRIKERAEAEARDREEKATAARMEADRKRLEALHLTQAATAAKP